MNSRWAVQVDADAAATVAALRLEPDIEVLESADVVWLRGTSSDERLDRLLRQLPGAARFEVLADGQLLPSGKRLPSGRLPNGSWVALKSLTRVALPVATLGARSLKRIPFSLERVATYEEPNLLLTALAGWVAYAIDAPQVRLEKLTFAASSDGRALVRGRPLPPIAGARYCERSGVAVPCGWGWPAWLEAPLVREALGLGADELALFSESGTWESIAGDQFVRATRSAARLSATREDAW
jgi:hypothetical protein